jgi:hypothetical protein
MARKKKDKQEKKVPAHGFIFPRDEKKARIEATIYGMTRALGDFPELKTADIEIQAHISYERVHKLANDYPFYKRIFIENYSSGYRTNGERYKNDNKVYQDDCKLFNVLGETDFYAVMYGAIAEQQKVKA